MNDLEHRVAQHLHDTAQVAKPTPDLSSIIGREGRPTSLRRSGQSRLPTVAAAALLVVGIGGLILFANSRTPATQELPVVPVESSPASIPGTVPAATTPSATSTTTSTTTVPVTRPPRKPLFPVLNDPQPSDGPVTARVGWDATTASPASYAVVGRRIENGFTDLVTISVSAELNQAPPNGDEITATVLGQPAIVNGDVQVSWGSGPYFDAVGNAGAPLAFLQGLPPGAITAATPTDPSEPPQLAINSLPPDFEIVAAPYSAGNKPFTISQLQVGSDRFNVQVFPDSGLLRFPGGELRSIEIGGRPAWTTESWEYPAITWQLDDSNYAFVFANNMSRAETVAVANRLSFVDLATWRAQYPNLIEEGQPPSTTPP